MNSLQLQACEQAEVSAELAKGQEAEGVYELSDSELVAVSGGTALPSYDCSGL